MSDVAQYDAVVSWFGFHWIEDKSTLAEKIATALKPNGQVLFLIPLDKIDQHSYRSQAWEQAKQITPELQDDIELKLFHPEPQLYRDAFYQAGFFALSSALFTHTFTYPIAQYMSYLSSWAPEVRQLKEAGIDPMDYLQHVIAQHPVSERIEPSKILCNSLDGQSIFYQEKLLQYEGIKPATADEPAAHRATR